MRIRFQIGLCANAVPHFLGNGEKRLNHVGVKLRSGATLDFFSRGSVGERGTIGPIRCHGIQGIRNRKDPCSQRDLIPNQALRITAAIVGFVMSQHNLSGVRQKQVLTYQVVADVHMPAHDLGLLGIQFPWLKQNRIRNTYLADIVERCTESDFSKFFLVANHGLAYLQSVASHALGMGTEFGNGVLVHALQSQGARLKE